MNTYQLVLSQVLRHFLTIAAGFLAAYGVVADMQSELVETTINIAVPVILALVAQVWGYVTKRYFSALVVAAHEANPEEISLSTVIENVKAESRASGTILPLLSLIVICSVLMTGCPTSDKTIRTAKEASAKMSVYGTKVIQANIDSFKAGEINADQLHDLNVVTRKFVEGVKVYREAVRLTEQAIAAGEPQPTALKKLEAVFNSRVISAFLELVAKMKIIPGAHSEAVKTILAGIEIAISTISTVFGEYRNSQYQEVYTT